jgi:hypothetical protein
MTCALPSWSVIGPLLLPRGSSAAGLHERTIGFGAERSSDPGTRRDPDVAVVIASQVPRPHSKAIAGEGARFPRGPGQPVGVDEMLVGRARQGSRNARIGLPEVLRSIRPLKATVL